MILVAAFALSVAWGLARGGRLGNLASLPLRWGGIAVLAFALQIYLIYFPEATAEGLLSLHVLLLIASYLLLLGVVWKNRELSGVWLIGAGLVANFAVMLANGGYMPITREALAAVGHLQNALGAEAGARVLATKDVVLAREHTQLWFLSDIFALPPPFPIPSVFSLGDAMIAVGVFFLVQRGVGRRTSPVAIAE
jgi:Family of unknown function (DUF5317)